MSPKELASHRLKVLKTWAQRARDLAKDEKAFKNSLHPEVRKILAPKMPSPFPKLA